MLPWGWRWLLVLAGGCSAMACPAWAWRHPVVAVRREGRKPDLADLADLAVVPVRPG